MALCRTVSLLIGGALCLLWGPQVRGQEDGRARRQLQAECRFTPLDAGTLRLDVDYELQTTPTRPMSLRARALTAAGFDEQHFQSSIAPVEAGRHSTRILLTFTGTTPVEVTDVWVELLAEGRDRPRATKAFAFRRSFPLNVEASSPPATQAPSPSTPVESVADLQAVRQRLADARSTEPPTAEEQAAPRVLRGWSVRRVATDTVEVCASCDTSDIAEGGVVVAAALLSRLPATRDSAPTLLPDAAPAAVLLPTGVEGWSGTLLLVYPHKLQARAAGVRVAVIQHSTQTVVDLEDIAHRMALSPAPAEEPGGEAASTAAPAADTPSGPDRPSIRPTSTATGTNGAAELLRLPAADLGSSRSLAQPGDRRAGIIKLWAVRQLEPNLVEVQVVCKSPEAPLPKLTVTGALLRSIPADPLSPPHLLEAVAPVSATAEEQDGQAVAVLCLPYLGKEEVTVAGARLIVTSEGQKGALDVLDTERCMRLSQPQSAP